MRLRETIATMTLAFVVSWSLPAGAAMKPRMTKQAFGKTEDGRQVDLYTLTNSSGMEVTITNYGGAVVSLKVPDRTGKLEDVVLGYDTLDGYVKDKAYFGAIIGRYANRIAHGQFKLDGVTYNVPKNDGDNSLHGGKIGFNKRLWSAKDISASNGPALQLTYLSKDGEEGFPGNLSVKVVYKLTDRNELKIDYSATTDKDTVLNLTNHSYFNLDGEGNGEVLGQEMRIHAHHFTPVNPNLIPTGEIASVEGTPLDFTKATTIGARINADYQQLKLARGYDHNWVVDQEKGKALVLAAEAYSPKSGRVLRVFTTQPGIQFYTGNFLDGTVRGKQGKVYNYRYAFCLETQHYPDSPNQSNFPSTELKPGQQYHQTTVYQFSTK